MTSGLKITKRALAVAALVAAALPASAFAAPSDVQGPTGTVNSGDVGVSFTPDVLDLEGYACWLSADGVPVVDGSTVDCSLGFASWDPDEGTYAISVDAIAGGIPAGAPVTTAAFTVDDTDPTVTIIGPNSPTNVTNPNLKVNVTDATAVTYECSLEPESPQATQPTCDGSGNISYAGLVHGTTYTFTAVVTDDAGNDAEETHAFTIDTDPPNTTITAAPLNPGNNASPTFSFTSTEAGSTFSCTLAPQGQVGAPAQCNGGSAPYTNLADGTYTFTVAATDPAGNTDESPDTRTFRIDTVQPNTGLSLSGPSGTVKTPNVTFTFTSNEASAFNCTLAGPTPVAGPAPSVTEACGSGLGGSKTYTLTADGSYTFTVVATDLAGNTSAASQTRSFTADITAPDTILDAGGPSGTVAGRDHTFTFSATEAGSQLRCTLTRAGSDPFTQLCTAGTMSYVGLLDGDYTFSVAATDAAGNPDITPPTRTFTVAGPQPETQIVTGPAQSVTDTNATFTFAGGSTYRCSLDGAPSVVCATPKPYAGLALGAHTLAVAAVNSSGVEDPTPATWSWTVNAVIQVATPPVRTAGAVTPSVRGDQSPRRVLAQLAKRVRGGITLPRSRRLDVGRIACAENAVSYCVVSTTLVTRKPVKVKGQAKAKRIVLGTGKVRVWGGDNDPIRVLVGKRQAKAVAELKAVPVTATMTVRDRAGNVRTFTSSFLLASPDA